MNQLELANFALGRIGQYRITSWGESSASGQALLSAWDIVRDGCLAKGNWNFARKPAVLTAAVAPVGGEWSNYFTLPEDFVSLVKCNGAWSGLGGSDFAVEQTLLGTTSTTATISYISRVTDPALWHAHFQMFFAFALAEAVATPLSLSPEMAAAMATQKQREWITAMTSGALQRPPMVQTAFHN